MGRAFFRNMAAAAAIALAVVAVPAGAQMMSEGFEFLKAVKDRDGDKVTQALDKPGATVIGARDLTTGDGVLHIVTQRRDLVWLEFLLSRGANPNAENAKGVSPLALATSLGWLEGMDALLGAGARVDDANSTGETPLITAVHRRDAAMARLLLAKGADPDRSDNSGRTARDYAQLLGASSPVLDEIAKADTARKGGGHKSYGPKL
ncbi:MAG: ankyrin repeat domain-containing protein [Tsuneonella sp.]